MSDVAAPLVWIDLEMTGLDPLTSQILEIAVLVTDADLNVLAEGPELVIHAPATVLAAMDAWNTEHHGASGLTQKARDSRIEVAEAEAQVLGFVRAHTPAGTAPLCGNSVWRDRRFLARYMPTLDAHLHYRIVDVSTIKELCMRWRPDLSPPVKSDTHRAMEDIRASVQELRFYRQHMFK